jgi:AcrR family transcriptional regulator
LYRYRPGVAKPGAHAESAPPGLHRLPPGRHGLPREFVARNQQDRLVAGTIAAVSEHGYHEATISQISAAAGVSRRTFYVYFEDKQECFLASYDRVADHIRQAAEEAAGSEASWPLRVAARLGAVLETFAANPQLATFTLAVPPRAGGEVTAHFQAALERGLAELTEGMPPPPAVRPPSQAVQHSLIGGIASLIVERVEAGEGERLGELHPDLVELFLSPFIGRAEAVRITAAV